MRRVQLSIDPPRPVILSGVCPSARGWTDGVEEPLQAKSCYEASGHFRYAGRRRLSGENPSKHPRKNILQKGLSTAHVPCWRTEHTPLKMTT
jgi:hypothetical protein